MVSRQTDAQTVRYRITDGNTTSEANITFAPGDTERDIVIPVNAASWSGVVQVRLWDPDRVDSLPDDDVGKITIQLSGSSASITELQVFIEGSNMIWPGLASTPLVTPGLRNLGLHADDGIEIVEDPEHMSNLPRRTRLAAFVSDDIRGSIAVGQVQRIQVGNLDPFATTPTGTISASIIALAVDGELQNSGHPARAIEYISAGNGIAGSIVAAGDDDFTPGYTWTYASIGKVIVGPSELATGIRGHIRAERGRIGSVYSTGPIGSLTERAVIIAGDGINEVRTISEVSAALVAADIDADITASAAPFAGINWEQEGVVRLIETGGDLRGRSSPGVCTRR